ncbi:MAG: hypothetical protein ABI939_07930 [Anaerolineaceae bacterium]
MANRFRKPYKLNYHGTHERGGEDVLRISLLLAMNATLALVALTAACSESDDAPGGRPSASATAQLPVTGEWPPGGKVPAALSGLWYETSTSSTITLDGNDYKIVEPSQIAHGNVVVNGDEIDFFNGAACAVKLPGGVGKYRWAVVGNSEVRFTALNQDPCGRVDNLVGVTWTRTPGSATTR